MEFRELTIRIDRARDGSFSAVASEGMRETRRQEFRIPAAFAAAHAASSAAATLQVPAAWERRDVETESVPWGVSGTDLNEVGKQLFDALLQGEIGFLYGTLPTSTSHGVRLRISVGSSDPEMAPIASIPWELLVSSHESDMCLALSHRHTVVRSLALPVPLDVAEIPRPLRILLVRANPTGSQRLDLERESTQVATRWLGALDTEVVNVAPTRDALREHLDSQRFHVLHFMGHGTFSDAEGQGAILLERNGGAPDPLYAEELRVMVADCGLRLVFLNACKTGASDAAAHEPFGGLAAALIAGGLPSVVANQFPISDHSAIEFADEFYTRLASGVPVDLAMNAGRRRLFRVNDSEWATPVLYLRARSGQLFTMQPHARSAAPGITRRDPTVFLAATSPTLDDVRNGLSRALRASGVAVLSATTDDEDNVRTQMSAADLTVHLLDADPGMPRAHTGAPRDDIPDTEPLHQLVLASQSARSQFILYEPPLDAATIPDERYAAYFEAVIRRQRDARRFEVRSESRSRMRDAILARLKLLAPGAEAEAAAAVATPDFNLNRVYIDVHSSDVSAASPLFRALRDRDLSVTLGGRVATGTPALRLAAAEAEVARSDLVILVFGDVAQEWAGQRFQWLEQLLSRLELQTRIAIFTPTAKEPAELRFNSRTKYPVFDTETVLAAAALNAVLTSV